MYRLENVSQTISVRRNSLTGLFVYENSTVILNNDMFYTKLVDNHLKVIGGNYNSLIIKTVSRKYDKEIIRWSK